MSALTTFSLRQQSLLKLLLLHRPGLTVDTLARELAISRNAVVQHLSSLEASGYVESAAVAGQRGRPSKLYTLTGAGLELFPRHYDMLANLLVGSIRDNLGSEQLSQWLEDLGQRLARDFSHRVDPAASIEEKIAATAAILHELGYEARVGEDPKKPEIIASNCVFHNLAMECQQVCQLDLSLLSTLLGREIEHRECMAKGGGCCRFGVEDSGG